MQADLKAFARSGVYGLSAITAVTTQNSSGVQAIHALPPRIVGAQIDAVLQDIGADAIKIGMLANAAIVRAVARSLRAWLTPGTPVVLDPLLAATTGARLLSASGVHALLRELLPLTTVLTPNVGEARALLAHAGEPEQADGTDDVLARGLLALGPSSVVLTGGHRAHGGDLYCDGEHLVELGGERYASEATHGSGCTHSALLAAELALGHTPLEAARSAATGAAEAVRDGLAELGHGVGPVDVLGLARRQARS
jgi:hydroxymethylpyrimidine/phosphomethylpyrimidine kinase